MVVAATAHSAKTNGHSLRTISILMIGMILAQSDMTSGHSLGTISMSDDWHYHHTFGDDEWVPYSYN
jgi:hypothetical protein